MNERLAQICRQAITDRVFPGCQLGYVRDGQVVTREFGRLGYEASAPEVQADTRYDVASVTKSIPTASLLLKLVEDGEVRLDDKVADYLPELDNEYRERVLIRHLLTYTVVIDLPGGLSALALRDPEHLLESLMSAPLLAPPGEKYYYTNPPAILAGLIANKVTGRDLEALSKELFFEPLGMGQTSFNVSDSDKALVAPSEIDSRGEVQGEPHDEAAWVLRRQGLIAGHAGLFSTAGDLMKFAQMMLADGATDGKRYLKAETIERMGQNQNQPDIEPAGLGWEISRPDVMGRAQRPGRLMKSGFTGCWVAIDRGEQSALVLLSNRTYPKRPGREPFQAFLRSLNEEFFTLSQD